MYNATKFYTPESISFQNDAFHAAMTGIIEAHRNDSKAARRTELELSIGECIKEYTNINVDVSIGDVPMMTEPPMIDKNSPMVEGYGWKESSLSKRGLEDIRKSKNQEQRALLDPNKSYVHGYFANMAPVRQYLNAPMIYGNKGTLYKIFDGREYTSAEISAIILHEVGHLWAFLEMMVHYRTSNQILSAMSRELDGTVDFGKRELIIREAASQLQLEKVDSTALSNKNNLTIYTIFISNMARTNKSQTGDGYDINSFEALADQFAARHGAARDLTTGLAKLYKGTIYRRGWIGYMFAELVKVALLGLGVFELATGNIIGSMQTAIILFTLVLSDSHHEWYDKGGARFKRIRNQLVEELKNPDLSKESSHRIRYDIEIIDKVSEDFKDRTQLIGLVYDYLTPAGISDRKQIEFQQALEELAANKLFFYSNKIKHL